jgi:glyoxylase-like metal-dependent hydrolase (beta-lactamase superfamily II)
MRDMQIHRIGDVTILGDHIEIPGLGFMPVSAYVLHAQQPLVIDTGLSTADKDFLSALGQVLDPADVRWVWITHPDRDHTGGLWALLDAAPNARLVSTFIGVGIMSCQWPIPADRVRLLNPGQVLDLGDRRLHAFRPPLFDNPATTGFLDDRSGALFTSDCFGAPLPSPELATSADVRSRGRASRPATVVGISRQPVGAPGQSRKIPGDGRPHPGHGRLRRLQHAPATSTPAARSTVRNRATCAAGAAVRRTRPGRT